VAVGVETGVEVGPEVPAVGGVVGVVVVGAAVTVVPVHPEARMLRQTPATIDVMTERFPSMRTTIATGT
jgi:hypothetical protein